MDWPACIIRYQLILRLLLGADAEPSASDEKGWAPLHFLFKSFQWLQPYEGQFAAVKAILETGAHIDQLNSQGQTPLDFCKSLLLFRVIVCGAARLLRSIDSPTAKNNGDVFLKEKMIYAHISPRDACRNLAKRREAGWKPDEGGPPPSTSHLTRWYSQSNQKKEWKLKKNLL